MKKSIYKPETEKDLTVSEFMEQHDYSKEPTRNAKVSAAWARKNMLLDIWNQWLAWEEGVAEKVGPYAEGQGWRCLAEQRRYEQVYNFSQYLESYAKEMKKDMDEYVEEERKQNAIDLADDLINSGVL